MAFQALLSSVACSNEADRCMLAAHASMLAHGFICLGTEPPREQAKPLVEATAAGAVSLCILPPDWNKSSAQSYSFVYMHPLRGAEETFELKAVVMAEFLALHAASSLPNADLLQVKLKIGASEASSEWEASVASGIAVRLLKHPTMSALRQALEESSEVRTSGTKRPASPPGTRPTPERDTRGPPFAPGVPPYGTSPLPQGGGSPLLWTPNGGLIGPRHPAWGQGIIPGLGRHPDPRGGGGLMPRFDPIGPGGMDPDPDHLAVPGLPGRPGMGIHPDFPQHFFQGGAGRNRDLDPFIM